MTADANLSTDSFAESSFSFTFCFGFSAGPPCASCPDFPASESRISSAFATSFAIADLPCTSSVGSCFLGPTGSSEMIASTFAAMRSFLPGLPSLAIVRLCGSRFLRPDVPSFFSVSAPEAAFSLAAIRARAAFLRALPARAATFSFSVIGGSGGGVSGCG